MPVPVEQLLNSEILKPARYLGNEFGAVRKPWDNAIVRGTLIDIWLIAMAIASLVVLLKFPKFNSAWLLIAGAAIGWLLKAHY